MSEGARCDTTAEGRCSGATAPSEQAAESGATDETGGAFDPLAEEGLAPSPENLPGVEGALHGAAVAERCITYSAMPHQLRVLNSAKRYIFLGAGVGAGKTDVGSLWTLRQASRTPRGVLGLVAANTYSQLLDSTVRNLYKNLELWGVRATPETPPKTRGPFNIALDVGSHKVEVLCRSLENYTMLAGIEFGWEWIDECFLASREAMDVLMARLRDARMHNQMLLTTTLDEPGGWMHRMFVEEYDPERMEVVYAKTTDNWRLPPEYVAGLKAMYDEKLYARMVEARWVSLSGACIYYNFDRTAHVSAAAEFDPSLPILWSHDFNIGAGKPMSSVLAHLRRDAEGARLDVFDEIVMDTADTNDAVREFMARPWLARSKAGVIVYGDASGRAKDTRSRKTDYSILAQAGFASQKVPRSNPPVRRRHNTVNALLKAADGSTRLHVHPRCLALAKGLEMARLLPGSGYLEDDSLREQHVTTALGYLCCREFTM